MSSRPPRRLRWVLLCAAAMAVCATVVWAAVRKPSAAQPLSKLETGDLVFQTTRGKLAAVIHAATLSKYTHVGVVVMRKGAPWILEASGPVGMTRFRRFVRRGVGGRYVVKRIKGGLTSIQKRRLVRAGRKYLKRRYDATFRWSDKRMYCSELVWKAYARGLKIRVGEPQTMGELYNVYNPIVRRFAKRAYGDHLPTKELIVTPVRMFDSKLLETIHVNTLL